MHFCSSFDEVLETIKLPIYCYLDEAQIELAEPPQKNSTLNPAASLNSIKLLLELLPEPRPDLHLLRWRHLAGDHRQDQSSNETVHSAQRKSP
jgi:hypothetical protein